MTSHDINLTVTHRSKPFVISLDPTTTFSEFQARITELTAVPPEFQKLLYKGKLSTSPDSSLEAAGLQDGMRITLLGNPPEAIEGLVEAGKQQRKREDILRARAAKAPVKTRSTGPSKPPSSYRFHKIEPLRHLPDPSRAEALLKKLASDPAIAHIMEEHKFAVGVLSELAPHEHPQLLGLNKNAGQAILLRLRTDAYDGFRHYPEIRRVLCHELTHNVWGDHDDNFKTLNSRLNREVAEYERHLKNNTHSLAGSTYQPLEDDITAVDQSYILGGGSASSSSNLSASERRQRVLEATLRRLEAEEKRIEDMCGSGNPPA